MGQLEEKIEKETRESIPIKIFYRILFYILYAYDWIVFTERQIHKHVIKPLLDRILEVLFTLIPEPRKKKKSKNHFKRASR